MTKSIKVALFCIFSVLFFSEFSFSANGILLCNDQLNKDPSKNSSVIVKKISKGTKVEIIKRQGAWYKVKYQKKEGWLSLFSIAESESSGLSLNKESSAQVGQTLKEVATFSKNKKSNNIIVSGVRGLSDEDLKKAAYSETEIKKLDSYLVSSELAIEFANEEKIKALGERK